LFKTISAGERKGGKKEEKMNCRNQFTSSLKERRTTATIESSTAVHFFFSF
jgi:hypothetical protein